MGDLSSRNKRFLIGCMGTRFAVTLLAWKVPTLLPVLAIFAAGVSIGMMTIFLTGSRKIGIETEGEKIWWNSIRPVHSILWGAFAWYAWCRNPHAWKWLLLDTLFGLAAFSTQRAGILFQ